MNSRRFVRECKDFEKLNEMEVSRKTGQSSCLLMVGTMHGIGLRSFDPAVDNLANEIVGKGTYDPGLDPVPGFGFSP